MIVDPEVQDGAVLVQIKPLPPLDQLKLIWRELEMRAQPSFFLSWHWIGTWLTESNARPALVIARLNDVIVGLALIGQDCARLGPLRFPRIHLNQAGITDLDCVCIEYNDLLVDRRHARSTRAACLDALYGRSTTIGGVEWEEMRWAASAVPAEQMPANQNMVIEKSKVVVSPYVDLNVVRAEGNDYLKLLSSNARCQIRRAIRLYEAMGRLRLERASTDEECLAWLERLRCLHQARWTTRGKPGAFARPFFERFAQRLIEREFGEGVIDMLRVNAGQHELGYLYNFVYRDCVFNYQSGFRFGPDGRYKPGLVAHALAVQHYARTDSRLRKYSFLAGASRYKSTLSTGADQLICYAFRPALPRLKLKRAIEIVIKATKRTLEQLPQMRLLI